MNSLHSDIKFIFENISTVQNILDVSCSIENDQLIFDIYHKPIHSFSYLHYRSCHPQHTRNIILSLGQRNIRIISENKEQHLNNLKSCLTQCSQPEKVLQGSKNLKCWCMKFCVSCVDFWCTCPPQENSHLDSIFP